MRGAWTNRDPGPTRPPEHVSRFLPRDIACCARRLPDPRLAVKRLLAQMILYIPNGDLTNIETGATGQDLETGCRSAVHRPKASSSRRMIGIIDLLAVS
jgi:hypothetical protein